MWDRFLRACRGEPVDVTPVWFMRQAGRYMPEYRAIRARRTLLEICKEPELATEVTLQPVNAFAVDAAILFADILLPLEPMGAPFEFAAGEGPRVFDPVRDRAGVERLRLFEPEEGLGYVLTAIKNIRKELDGRVPLIGFAGAPFTLASYLVEGGKSAHYGLTKRMMYAEPELWAELMGKLSEVVRRYLRAQVQAGAQAVQLFDSWVGALSPADYVAFVQPHVAHILKDLETTGVPVLHFGTGTAMLLEHQRTAGGHVLGVDWRTPLGFARRVVGEGVPLQGNLDPLLLQAPRELLATRVREVLEAAKGGPHIFNLGHGILPETDPEQVKFVADFVHEQSARS
ncbi:MAG: uroporphyrinogen decarboxylase [Polyangiaceae bacterium]|nr:uroporphyrinogen decarboxylase [Polyangiaceae bacterium]MCW5789660.1 uroporphyrinogen decarboxylase [Polyangiaceae bacterium]